MSERATGSAERISDRLEECRAYAGTPMFTHLIGLLEELAEAYRIELEHVSPEELKRPQSALRQVRALRDSMLAPQGAQTLPLI